jgi:superfamily II DNA/RNA helicase
VQTNDLTFITNQNGQSLLDRFRVLIKDTLFFDCIVGYFYASGFYKLQDILENTEKIRILIGIGTDRQTIDLINSSKASFSEIKQICSQRVVEEAEEAENDFDLENGVLKFKELIKSGKIEIRAYPESNLHAKLYIITFKEGDRDVGRVITGSSNFSQSGLADNLEFNVELKSRSDYEFAREKFEELWKQAVEVSDDYIDSIEKRTHLRDDITPYELYLKFLYEYFKRDLEETGEIYTTDFPENFLQLEYQKQAVLNSKRILEDYGGVFLSDVVGLGKTYMAATLASQLDGRTLILASPVLIDTKNPGSWVNVFRDFNLKFDAESIGQLKKVKDEYNLDKYKNIIIDESHRFRTEDTVSYTYLSEICRGKRVILVSATPYNNSSEDILSQIKLFQNTRKSTIPGLPDLEGFFKKLDNNLKKIDKKNYEDYVKKAKENARLIRERVLKYLMIRRTRGEIERYFIQDLEKNKIKFPQVNDPVALFYELNEEEDEIFDKTLELITKNISYARYTPLLYLKNNSGSQVEVLGQKNMGTFMKVLLLKRLESSFYAFKLTIDRFKKAYKKYIDEFEKGSVYVSKKYSNKIFEYLENDDDESIQRLIDQDKATKYSSSDFTEEFKINLSSDYETFCQIDKMWSKINSDPKFQKFYEQLKTNTVLKDKKIIIFSESKETVDYLARKIEEALNKNVLAFSSSANEEVRRKVIENFDAKAKIQKDDYSVLVSTEVLSEGVNLHCSNVIINYDIPWNPTRMMQRAGRINRIDTKFENLYIFNFFPTKQSNDEIHLEEIAKSKINAFLTLLGEDAAVLTEGEPITSHELFGRLTSMHTITQENEGEESELKYFNIIKEIREKNQGLFNKIKHLPKKSRTAKSSKLYHKALLTYLKKGKIEKFYFTTGEGSKELDFSDAAKLMESSSNDKKEKLTKDFYSLLRENIDAFTNDLNEEPSLLQRRGKSTSIEILKHIKALDKSKFTDRQENYIKTLQRQLEDGAIPKELQRKTLKAIEGSAGKLNPLKVLGAIQKAFPERFLREHYAKSSQEGSDRSEVILSMYLKGEQ